MAKDKREITVLVVDDDEDTLMIYDKILAKAGYKILKARNGDESLSKAKDARPDIIVMDIMMPKSDGMSAILKLKSDERTRHIPVVVATSLEEPEDQTVARNLGVAGYIIKRSDMGNLLEKIKEVLGNEKL
jgi:two-component system, OmpR family, alkaline phosphatase synthesis response regulator PhoP